MSSEKYRIGVDIGSVSVNLAVLDSESDIVEQQYLRHHGQSMPVAARGLRDIIDSYGADNIEGIATTGSGGRILSELLEIEFINEVVAQGTAAAHLHPQARAVIEIGGEDSKLIHLEESEDTGEIEIVDFAMNSMCAAGTGAFLDKQANRLGLDIEEFAEIALKSEEPPRVAGRCSVFAKTDMIHLQQKATPTYDIVGGLCYALARNFRSTVGSARDIDPPVAFHGGVAANPGIVRAMYDVYDLPEDDLIVSEYHAATGAIGAVLKAGDNISMPDPAKLDEAEDYEVQARDEKALDPLELDKSVIMESEIVEPDVSDGERIPAYLGVDVGSISTNVVVMDEDENILAKEYLMTAGEPLNAVQTGLRRIGEKVADIVDIRGACTTGSGRYLTGDFIGADVIKNEITAHATGALSVDADVDTIFEIGGQDAKYTHLESGHVIDFDMNKVCAAGTGSFLEEQAEKLDLSIEDEFADLAFEADEPADLGERCTVFMETELVRHQQAGADTEQLVAGLAYSIVYNYLNRVVDRKPVGDHIFFQGGTAFNEAVVAAFESITGKRITAPPHNEVLGAIGCALLARDHDTGDGSDFKGFDLSERDYSIETFVCQDCPNQCEINKVTVEGEAPLFYGSRCGKYDVDQRKDEFEGIPDLFAEREELLKSTYESEEPLDDDAPTVGIPSGMLYHELYPMWKAMLTELGCKIVLSEATNKRIIHRGAERSVVETCFPMKVMLGHVLDLLEEDIDYLWLPSTVNMDTKDPNMTDSFVCPYTQSFPYTIKAATDIEEHDVEVLQPVMYLAHAPKQLQQAMQSVGDQLGKSGREVRQAVQAGLEAQKQFRAALRERGEQVLANLPDDTPSIVLVSRPYNGCDQGANLEIPRKLRRMGVLAIPMDFLPLDEAELPGDWFNMYWRYGQKILSSAEIIADNPKLHAVYLTNFGCGPDSFLTRYFQERLGTEPALVIEVDEHSADAGIITRLEAFLDSIEATKHREFGRGRTFRPLTIDSDSKRTMLIPNMSEHAYALEAAFEACGMPAEVLPEPDEETLLWGRRHTTGKECFPCIVTTGDMVKRIKQPDFNRDDYAFFMGGSGGPCRFGQYNALQRMVLDDLGYKDVPIYAPNQASGFFDDLNMVGRKFLRIAWQGMVAVDVIYKARLETRPYETEPGATRAAFDASLQEIRQAVRNEGRGLQQVLESSRQRFEAVPKDRSEQKPVIGLVGEFYIRANRFSNENLIAKIEKLGGEVWMAPVYEWFLYRNFRRDMRAKLDGDLKLRVKNWLKDRVMVSDEHKLIASFDGYLRNAHEPSTGDVLELAERYVDKSFEGEAIMTVGKAIDFAEKGLSGIVAVMPFTCMPGTVAHALMKNVSDDEDNIPFLNMVYDGSEQSTSQTRIEAFMHRAREYMERTELTSVGHE